ncbi:prolipoprotein diacylglyceryl transferase [Curtobacterium ammoniigenes]|uniref:prolipoprotein diacylglyceryl transferase n=1 Tax=Curtobacterium ammoniigenes TaxID=395387 RepID=UPI000830D37C|nr:prolipoprotein diacylglyceryl transferase [Curtobacterium ammoniigenes]
MPLLSIPSPSAAWQYADVTSWLNSAFGWSLPFDFRIQSYAVCILLGIIAAVVLTNVRLARRGAEPWVIVDIAIWAVPLGVIGARIWFVLAHLGDYFGAGHNPASVLAIWDGGLSIFGGLLLGAIGAWAACRQLGLRFTTFVDALAPGFLLAQAFGRLGDWFNHSVFGAPTSAWWGLQIESTNPAYPKGLPAGTLFEPTFLWEIIWDLVGVALLVALDRRFRLQWGRLLALYLVWYGIARVVLDSIRVDAAPTLFGVRLTVWAGWVAIIVGLVVFAVQHRRHRGPEPDAYLPGKLPASRLHVVSDDTYSEHDDEDDPIVDAESEPVAAAADRS